MSNKKLLTDEEVLQFLAKLRKYWFFGVNGTFHDSTMLLREGVVEILGFFLTWIMVIYVCMLLRFFLLHIEGLTDFEIKNINVCVCVF